MFSACPVVPDRGGDAILAAGAVRIDDSNRKSAHDALAYRSDLPSNAIAVEAVDDFMAANWSAVRAAIADHKLVTLHRSGMDCVA